MAVMGRMVIAFLQRFLERCVSQSDVVLVPRGSI
jgi:hypothetical protein